MNDLDKEYFLQRVMAVSGFLFALCILPVAQYVLVTSQTGTSATASHGGIKQEAGQVAGVTTEATSTSGAEQLLPAAVQAEQEAQAGIPTIQRYASMSACIDDRDKKINDLDQWGEGKKRALVREYDQSVQAYKQQLTQLQLQEGGTVEAEIQALQASIQTEYATYLRKLGEVQKAITSQRTALERKDCQAVSE